MKMDDLYNLIENLSELKEKAQKWDELVNNKNNEKMIVMPVDRLDELVESSMFLYNSKTGDTSKTHYTCKMKLCVEVETKTPKVQGEEYNFKKQKEIKDDAFEELLDKLEARYID